MRHGLVLSRVAGKNQVGEARAVGETAVPRTRSSHGVLATHVSFTFGLPRFPFYLKQPLPENLAVLLILRSELYWKTGFEHEDWLPFGPCHFLNYQAHFELFSCLPLIYL